MIAAHPPQFDGTTRAAQEASSALSRSDDRQVWDARRLTGAAGQACIVLGDQVYTLRITRTGKLILTK
jgi:hemin uptake protein HemP